MLGSSGFWSTWTISIDFNGTLLHIVYQPNIMIIIIIIIAARC